MRELAGKTAFVTGGASGIGLALGRAFAEAGMNVMLADIEMDALSAAVKSLHNVGPDVRGVICDVTDPGSVERAADASYEAFGQVHVVCNNAGVAGGGGIDDIPLDDWRWVLDVNLMGVLHGIRTFLPHIRAHGEGGHIVNTASMAGMVSGLGFGPYSASKFAVVAMSEGLAMHLKPLGIGVSVLCPGWVRTRITESARNRSERYGPARPPDPTGPANVVAELVQSGLDPSVVAQRVLTAIRKDQLYVFTHPEMRAAGKSGSPQSWRRWTRQLPIGDWPARLFVSFRLLPPPLNRSEAMAGPRRGKREKSDAKGARILLVEARYYDDIADFLLAGAMKVLNEAGAEVERVTVPGSLEIPSAYRHRVDAAKHKGRALRRRGGARLRDPRRHHPLRDRLAAFGARIAGAFGRARPADRQRHRHRQYADAGARPRAR